MSPACKHEANNSSLYACCANAMNYAQLSDRAWLVISAYLAAFLPWGLLAVVDFISSKWRTVGETRRSGLLHLFFSVFPLSVVVFYLHVQRVAQDYKEMMAAVVATALCFFNIARTVWGLMQLQAYRAWCTRALVCIYRMGYADRVKEAHFRVYEDWKHQMMHFYRVRTQQSKEPGDLRNAADTEVLKCMLVNSSLIDNEFITVDLPVILQYPKCGLLKGCMNLIHGHTEDWLCTTMLVHCSLRWTLSFLSQFGRRWVDSFSVCHNISDSLRKANGHVFKNGKKVLSFFEMADKIPFDSVKIRDSSLPYSSDVLSDFEQILEAHHETLANQLKFYNAGALDNLDYLLQSVELEVEVKNKSTQFDDSISKITTKHITAFLKLMSIIDHEDECRIELEQQGLDKARGNVGDESHRSERIQAVIQKRVTTAEQFSFADLHV